MSSSKDRSEQLLDKGRDESIVQDNWMAVLYDDIPLTYTRLDEGEMDIFRDEPGYETYHDFLMKLDRNREDVSEKIRSLDSYSIIDRTFEVNPGVLRRFAGDDFERYIDKEVMDRRDRRERNDVKEEIEDRSDRVSEGMNPIVRSAVGGRLEEFKKSMHRKPILQDGVVVYEESLRDLYTTIEKLQRTD